MGFLLTWMLLVAPSWSLSTYTPTTLMSRTLSTPTMPPCTLQGQVRKRRNQMDISMQPVPSEEQQAQRCTPREASASALGAASLGLADDDSYRPGLARIGLWKRLRLGRSTTTTLPATDYQWNKQNMAIALPALVGLLADPVLSMVDTVFVGRISALDLAALGVCTSIFHMAFTVFRASTVATTALVGSAKSETEKRQITKLSLQLAGVLGAGLLLALRLGGPRMLNTMGVPATSPLYKPACDYLYARCWAAPAVVGIVVAEGAFRGNDDYKTPLVASIIAAFINLVLDPLFMIPMGLGMVGAAAATAMSQVGAAGVYGWRLFQRRLLPQPHEKNIINRAKVIQSILDANLAMLAKQGSLLVFYTAATALATRMGPAHVATHQVALSLFWLTTYWLDSGSMSGQVLMSKNMNKPRTTVRSLTKYMLKYALMQGLAFSALVVGIGNYVPGVFTQDATIQSLLAKCLPHLAFQQTLVSITLILEGLAIGGNQFRYMAMGTAAATAAGLLQLAQATSVVGIWSTAFNTFFGCRLLNAIIGVVRVHRGRNNRRNEQEDDNTESPPVIAAATG